MELLGWPIRRMRGGRAKSASSVEIRVDREGPSQV